MSLLYMAYNHYFNADNFNVLFRDNLCFFVDLFSSFCLLLFVCACVRAFVCVNFQLTKIQNESGAIMVNCYVLSCM